MITAEEITEELKNAGYVSNPKISSAIAIAEITQKPLLIEGYPGVGKTSLAKAYAKARNYEFIRVQMYGGLTYDKILFDYDYQKQLLTLEALRPQIDKKYQNLTVEETVKLVVGDLNFYGPDFLIERPILKAVRSDHRTVLLIDEIDKASEDIEYMLYEFLESFAITIPQYGTIASDPATRPMVFITSNKYRDVSGPFQRRCAYLYIEEKRPEEIVDILQVKTKIDPILARELVKCYQIMGTQHFYSPPSISELSDLAQYLNLNPSRTKDFVLNSLSLIAKDNRDERIMYEIVLRNGSALWGGDPEEEKPKENVIKTNPIPQLVEAKADKPLSIDDLRD